MEPDDLIVVNQLGDQIPLPGYDMIDYGKLENGSVHNFKLLE